MLFKRISLLASTATTVLAMMACTTVMPQKPSPPPSPTEKTPAESVETQKEMLRPTTFSALPGWEKDALNEAWPAFLASCKILVKKTEWQEPCSIAHEIKIVNAHAVRTFFESFFIPYQLLNSDGSEVGLATGYYEPLLHGARKRGGPYQIPLYRAPEDLLTIELASVYPELKGMRLRGRLAGNKIVPYLSRAELIQTGALAGKELLWVNDPIEAFFLQVQGSGRVQLADTKETVRVAYADQNGHPYKSIGRYLIDKGELKLEQASMQGIKAWVAANPYRQEELLNANPSYVFFKEEKLSDSRQGPKGALGVPLTPERSVAIDPQFVPLGIPLFMTTTQPNSDIPLQRLVMAQDTGGAIKGAVRADYFWGSHAEAGEKAGKMKQPVKIWLLLPKLTRPYGKTEK